MKDSGPIEVLVLFGAVYVWIAWNLALSAAKRFYRFRVTTLLTTMTLFSVLLGLIVYMLRK